jgi:hypothetical protein
MSVARRELKVAVGDKVIYQPPTWLTNQRPRVTTVERLTAAGWPVVPEFKKAFRPLRWPLKFQSGDHDLYPYSEQKLAELNEAAERREQYEQEKREESARRADERERRLTEEMATTKTAYGDVLPIESKKILPDGSRLYVLNGLVTPDSGKGFDVLIIRVWQEPRYDYASSSETLRTMAAAVFCSGSNGFSISSNWTGFDSDEDALWDFLRYRYC